MKCKGSGINVNKNCRIHSNDIVVNGCDYCGLVVDGGSIVKLSGSLTKIENNCKRRLPDYYGVKIYPSSKIKIVSPLTMKSIVINNGDRKNWWGNGTIEHVRSVQQEKEKTVRDAAFCKDVSFFLKYFLI